MSKRQARPSAAQGSAKKKSKSLSSQIAALIDPTPRDQEDADDDDDRTEFEAGAMDYGDESNFMASGGRLRIQAGIDEDDEKYQGRIAQSDDDDESSEGEEPEGRHPAADDESEEEESGDEESDEEEVSGEQPEDEGALFQQELEQLQQEEQQVLAGISRVNSDEVQRAVAVRGQTKMWSELLELRIAVQGCLSNANRMPKAAMMDSFIENPQIAEKLEEAQQLAMAAVTDLQQLGANLNFVNDEASDGVDAECQDVEELWGSIAGRHDDSRAWREEQITWWGQKTMAARQLQGGKAFQSLAKDAMEQVKEVLSDMPRLIKRTQLKRSEYRIIGDVPKAKAPDAERDSHLNQHDPELFDDTDFYERLLQELIDTGSQASLQAALTGRTEVKKAKHQVDTRASKGRKIRYHVHQKLVNFMYANGFQMPPVTDELFSRLFGQPKEQ